MAAVEGGWSLLALVLGDAAAFAVVTLFGVSGLWEQLVGPNMVKSEETSSLKETRRMSRTHDMWSRGTRMYLWPGAEGTWLIQGTLGSSLWKLSASLFLHPDLPVCIYSKLLVQLHSDSQHHRNLMKFIVITTMFQYDIMA